MAPRDVVVLASFGPTFGSWYAHFSANPTDWTMDDATEGQVKSATKVLTDYDLILYPRHTPDFGGGDEQATDILPFINEALAAGIPIIFGASEDVGEDDPAFNPDILVLLGICEKTIVHNNNQPDGEVIDFSHIVTSDMLSVDPGDDLWSVKEIGFNANDNPPYFLLANDYPADKASSPHKDFDFTGTVLARGSSASANVDGHPVIMAIEPTDEPVQGKPAFPTRMGVYCAVSTIRGYPGDYLLERLSKWALGDFDSLSYATQATWDSQPVDMTSVGILASSLVQWEAVLPGQTSAVVLISINGGPFLQAVNGGPVPGLVDGVTDMTGLTITTRIFLQTSDPQATPQMDKVTVTIFGVLDQLPERTGFYSQGFVEWTTGANTGRKLEVLSWDLDTHKVILFLPTPHAIIPGDQFRVAPGCDKTPYGPEGCRDKWENMINFRAEPHVPSLDRISSVPDSVLQGIGGKKK